MTISVGDTLPEARLLRMGAEGAEGVSLSSLVMGRKVVIFGLPGAFTSTCSTAHVPSFMRVREKLLNKGVEEVICVSVNDAQVMKAWSDATGAGEAGITFLGDPGSEFTKAIDMAFTAAAAGFYDRSKRYALCAENGVVTVLHHGEETSACEISGGEAMLDAL